MKPKLKEQAIKLRQNGLSYNEILTTLSKKVSKSTLSLWLRDIKLSPQRQKRLDDNNPTNGINTNYELLRQNGKKRRKQFQNQGANECKNMNLHLAGCMLYWAEGANARGSLALVNTDLHMLKLFIRFLKECYGVNDTDILIRCHIHANLSNSLSKIEKYWLKELELPKSSLRKGSIETRENKRKKLKYKNGCCTVMLHKTEITQRIFGAIKQYAGTNDEDKWIG